MRLQFHLQRLVAPERVLGAYPNGHFYSPVVNPAEVAVEADRIWDDSLECAGIDFDSQGQRLLLVDDFPRLLEGFDYPQRREILACSTDYYLENSQFSWLDARALFVLIRKFMPRRIVEVGSGFSTLLMADVKRRFLDPGCSLTCIEPYPREFLRRPELDISLRVEQVQQTPLRVFSELEAGDVLFIDSSHVAKTGSDVNFLLFEVLPALKPGVYVHIHDIFLPREYPRSWVVDENRSWNEQYVVHALLMHSSALRIIFAADYAARAFPRLVEAALSLAPGTAFGGSSLWLVRT